MTGVRRVHVVVTCTHRKRLPVPGELHLRRVTGVRTETRARTWTSRLVGDPVRAVPAEGRQVRASSVPPTVQVTVYKPARATRFGPEFYGHRTACGQVLRPHTLGVANRTLRCGTAVAIYYRGRTITVPVIDRGPYANGADWDLTAATARALGIGGTAMIGAVSLPRHG